MLERLLQELEAQKDVPRSLAEAYFDAMVTETDTELLANILLAWNAKGVSDDEIHAFGALMRSRMVEVRSDHHSFVDIVGTGGSRLKTFNVSTASAFVTAGAGVPVAKHGNRAASSRSGSADVLSELGVEPAVGPKAAETSLNRNGICFMFAPLFHRLSPTLAAARRSVGGPTIFNILGPLSNPASAPHHVIGVWNDELVDKTANVLSRFGTRRSWVVCGNGGLDEVALDGPTRVAEVCDGAVRSFEIGPNSFGIETQLLNSSERLSPAESGRIILSILENEACEQPNERVVLINAAAAIYVSGRSPDLKTAYSIAKESVRSGAAKQKLVALRMAVV
jgi:anthranilate phosphoribosyltransferase